MTGMGGKCCEQGVITSVQKENYFDSRLMSDIERYSNIRYAALALSFDALELGYWRV
jgi:hypothetical protein